MVPRSFAKNFICNFVSDYIVIDVTAFHLKKPSVSEMEFEVAASNSLRGRIEVVASNGLKSLIKLYLMFKPRKMLPSMIF